MPKKNKAAEKAAKTFTPKTYDKFEVHRRYAGADGPITASEMEEILGWELEPEADAWKEEDIMLVDTNGRNARCHFNKDNRPLRREGAMRLAYEVLNRTWAGPTCFPGETVNGEAGIIGRDGHIISLQHRGIGLIFAKQLWDKDKHWKGKAYWPEDKYPDGPVMEMILVTGASNDPRILRTHDNTIVRTGADTLMTAGYFGKKSRAARERLCKTLNQSVKFLWDQAGLYDTTAFKYLSQTQIVELARTHPTLAEYVEFLSAEDERDDSRPVSRFLPVAKAAGLMYLMAASATTEEQRKKYLANPSEKHIDFANGEKARGFWIELVGMTEEVGKVVVRTKYPKEADEAEDESGDLIAWEEWTREIFPKDGSGPEPYRVATVTQAWNVYKDDGELTDENVHLEFQIDPNSDGTVGEVGGLKVTPVLGGLVPPDEEEQKDKDKQDQKSKSVEDMLAELKGNNGGRIILFKAKRKNADGEDIHGWKVWGPDADTCVKVLEISLDAKNKGGKNDPGTYRSAWFAASDYGEFTAKLIGAGHKLGVADWDQESEEYVVTPVDGKPIKAKAKMSPGNNPISTDKAKKIGANGDGKAAEQPAKDKPKTEKKRVVLRGGTN